MFIGRFPQRCDVLAYALSPILLWTLWVLLGRSGGFVLKNS